MGCETIMRTYDLLPPPGSTRPTAITAPLLPAIGKLQNREGRRISETLISVVGFWSKLSAACLDAIFGLGRARAPLAGPAGERQNLLPNLRSMPSIPLSEN